MELQLKGVCLSKRRGRRAKDVGAEERMHGEVYTEIDMLESWVGCFSCFHVFRRSRQVGEGVERRFSCNVHMHFTQVAHGRNPTGLIDLHKC